MSLRLVVALKGSYLDVDDFYPNPNPNPKARMFTSMISIIPEDEIADENDELKGLLGLDSESLISRLCERITPQNFEKYYEAAVLPCDMTIDELQSLTEERIDGHVLKPKDDGKDTVGHVDVGLDGGDVSDLREEGQRESMKPESGGGSSQEKKDKISSQEKKDKISRLLAAMDINKRDRALGSPTNRKTSMAEVSLTLNPKPSSWT